MTQLNAIAVDSLTKIYNERVIFKNIKFSLNSKRLLHITGENGSGKSTLLRGLAGLTEFSDGKIYFNNNQVFPNNICYRSLLFFLGHKNAVNLRLTALENCQFSPYCSNDSDLIKQTFSQLQLSKLSDKPCYQLSQGQRQRVALAALRWNKQPLWLLDEPYTSLDTNAEAWLTTEIQSHIDRGGFLIISSHQALNFSNTICQTLTLK